MDRQEVADVLEEIGALLELMGENPFKVRAYRKAARSIRNWQGEWSEVGELEGVGAHIAEKIGTLVKTGKLPYYEKLKRSVPKGLIELTSVQGLGPKRVKRLYEEMGVKSPAQLKKAAEQGKLKKVLGAKLEQKVVKALSHEQRRHLWLKAWQRAEEICSQLKGVKKIEIAGSLRRKLETVGDIDLLAMAKDPKVAMKSFLSLGEEISKGERKSAIRLKDGLQVDFRIFDEKEWPFGLIYSTGSKEHVVKLRELALKKKLSMSEYGFKGKKVPALKSEADIYKFLGLPYIPPELRENCGEFDHKIPKLIELSDIRGSFHNHTAASDGRNSLREMVDAAAALGWEYIGISDHSKSAVQAGGLSEEKLLKQIKEIRSLKTKIHVFAGLESDILPNGDLDYSDSILKQLDYVIVSIHSSMTQDEKTMTKRLIKAIEHPYSTIVGHLTARLLLRRDPIKVNITKVIDACIANGKIMEINGSPDRLDMDWRYWREAVQKGLRCSINADAHSTEGLRYVETGINIARKGWLTKADVINTLPLKEIKKFLN